MKLSLTLSSVLSAIQVLGKCETLKMIPRNPQYATYVEGMLSKWKVKHEEDTYTYTYIYI